MQHPLEDEVKSTIFSFSSGESQVPDGSELNPKIMECIASFFKGRSNLKFYRSYFFQLIPKTSTPIDMADFRLISFVGLIYRTLIKVLADRIRGLVNSSPQIRLPLLRNGSSWATSS